MTAAGDCLVAVKPTRGLSMSTSPIRVFIVEDQPAILKAQVKILSNAKELRDHRLSDER